MALLKTQATAWLVADLTAGWCMTFIDWVPACIVRWALEVLRWCVTQLQGDGRALLVSQGDAMVAHGTGPALTLLEDKCATLKQGPAVQPFLQMM